MITDVKKLGKFTQINFISDGDPTIPKKEYVMKEETTNELLNDGVRIINVNVPYYSETLYNKGVDKMSVGEKMIALLGADSMEKVNKICNGDKDLEAIAKRIEECQEEVAKEIAQGLSKKEKQQNQKNSVLLEITM